MNIFDALIDDALLLLSNNPNGFSAEDVADQILRIAPDDSGVAGVGRERLIEVVDHTLRRRYGPYSEEDLVTPEAFRAMTPEQQLKVISDLEEQAKRDAIMADALQALCAMKFGPRGAS